jgi:transposase-like protein
MTTDKRGISALLLQRQPGLGCYETAWMMLHQFRRAMVNLEREPLRGEVEVDDTWIGGTQAGLRGSRQLKGRKAALVIVAVEKRGKASGRVRMAVIPDFKSVTLNAFVQQNGAPASTIFTDGLKSFVGFEQTGFRHIPRTQPLQGDLRKGAKSVLPVRGSGHWQSTTMAHWNLSWREPRSTPGYLDEFVFRHNRRQTPMAAFQTLLGLSTARRPVPYTQIKGTSDLSGQVKKAEPTTYGALLK